MGAEKVVGAVGEARAGRRRVRKRRAPRAFGLWRFRDAPLPGVLAVAALGASCSGPLSDACGELGTCAPSPSADGGADASCDLTKDPKDEPCVLDSAYGVFVAPAAGSDAGDAETSGAESADPDGTSDKPYPSIGQALANLGGKSRIYVCNGSYEEQVSITAPVSLYGGLSCAGGSAGRAWSYVGQSAQVTAPPSGYALFVTGVQQGSVTIEDVSFAASDATAPGASSIAALVVSSTLRLARVTLSAGKGADGVAGADGLAAPNYTGAAPVGGSQVSAGPPGSGTLTIAGGAGAINQCAVSGMSAGGDGGLGCGGDGGSSGLGSPGTAMPPAPVTMAGRDGLPRGTILVDAGDAAILIDDPGADGVAGAGGIAAAAEDYGTLSASGWVPSPGGDGSPGDPGQGGAGATDPLYGECGTSSQSVGGGGGGAGGCGGAGGKGGGGGGGSIALASVASNVTLTACALNASDGGTGGAGGAGQDGQAGGQGGDTSFPSAHQAGAAGGNGAGGSGGAGGTGGISVGVLASGSTIASDGSTTETARLGSPGAGGAAGPAGRHGTAGSQTTGVDGTAGAPGSAGTSTALLTLM
jgi:Protein of unknown function (DUF1565)